MSKLTRRDFLRASAITAAGLAAASCAQPTPEVIEKEVVVEKIVKETVVTEKEVAVEKVVTATAVVSTYNEAPMLAGKVAAGELPPVDERLPETPMVVEVQEEIGQYGGVWHRLATSQGDIQLTARLTYENPIRWNDNGSEMVPNIAQSWEVSPDGTEFTFKLRPGMKWSDGEPYTADDWVFITKDHWGNKERQPNFPSTWAPGGTPVETIKVDDYTAKLKFAVPYGLCMVKMASSWGAEWSRRPAHYLKQFHADYADADKLASMTEDAGFEFWYQYYGDRNDQKANVDCPVIYAWKTIQPPPATPAVHERNPYYWKVDPQGNQLPYIDRLEHIIVSGKDQINLRAASGEVDMQARHITFDNFPIFKDSEETGDYRVLLWDQGMATDSVIAFNQTNKDPVLAEIVQDVRFLQAMSLGMNRDEIIQAVYLGMAEPNQVSPLPSSPFYMEEQAKNLIEYDPDRANALLDEMGLTEKDAEGYRLRPDGKRLIFVYEYAPVFGAWGDIGELLRAQWAKVGVEIQTKEEARQLWYERKAANEIDLMVWTGSAEFNIMIDPRHFIPFSNESLYAIQYAAWWNTNGAEGIEPTGDHRKVLEIYDEVKVTVDPDKQTELMREIVQINKDNLWNLGISTAPPQLVICKNSFRNVPEVGVSDWHLQTPGSTKCEQYFFKQ